MTCGVAHRPFTLEYQHLNFEGTQERMRAVAADASMIAYVMIGLVAVAETFKNMTFCLYNAAVFVINQVSWLIFKVGEVAQRILCCNAYRQAPIGPQVPIISTPFSVDDLLAFRAAAESSTSSANHADVYVETHRYQIWFDESTETVKIQDFQASNHPILSLGITEGGQVTSIQLDGVDQNTFPESFAVAMHGCFQKAYEFSSKYEVEGTHISARVIRRGLIENPEYHLDQLGERLAEMRNRQPSFGAKFLENDLTEQVGVDAGGLRRDFVGDLLKGLITHMNSLVFRKIHGSELYMPVASRHCSPGALPGLDWNESALYSKLGHLLMFSYLDHSNLVIGQCFERALFQAALSLTPEEVRTPFSHLGDATILKMARQIFEARGTPVHTLDFLQRSSEQRTNAEWTDMVNWASDAATWPQNLVFNPQNPEHRQHVVNGLKELIFEQVGHYLSPIHAIAQGMDLVKTRWAPTQRIELDQFIEKVQGSLDRATIANAIVASQIPYIDQRIRWLKEWIRDPETRVSDISNLIKFATGSPSLAVNGQIRVNPQAEVPGRPYNPALIGHSCFNTIDISPVPCTYGTYNNHDKANFIRAVKEMALTQAGEYSMA